MAALVRTLLAALIIIGLSVIATPTGIAQSAESNAETAHAEEAHAGDTHGDGHADDHGHAKHKAEPIAPAKQGIVPAIMTLVVFGAVVAFLAFGVWPKITKGLDEREAKILGEIEAAEDARKQAKAALAQYEASLAEARADAQKMIDDTKAQAATLSAELRAKNDAELSAMRDRAKRDIESAKQAALSEIYAQTSALATAVASKILEREVSAEDQARLVDEALRELNASNN